MGMTIAPLSVLRTLRPPRPRSHRGGVRPGVRRHFYVLVDLLPCWGIVPRSGGLKGPA